MERFVVEVQTPLQRLIVEQALALAQEFEQAADSAPDGEVLDRCERVQLADHGMDHLVEKSVEKSVSVHFSLEK